ncbi:hypothetical protein [Caldimonas brevitalea]|uniref:hypothetical protein n=1 Tax=Caldimonas brevitalea TaxID=413882 RepID=UPI00146FCB4E|nr:hypothetical protein [Caldimonas brevitalea]
MIAKVFQTLSVASCRRWTQTLPSRLSFETLRFSQLAAGAKTGRADLQRRRRDAEARQRYEALTARLLGRGLPATSVDLQLRVSPAERMRLIA